MGVSAMKKLAKRKKALTYKKVKLRNLDVIGAWAKVLDEYDIRGTKHYKVLITTEFYITDSDIMQAGGSNG